MATAEDRPRTRAKKACLACNARRVRCNVLEAQPCRNCVAWNLSCELGISRRGKYPRRKTGRSSRALGDHNERVAAFSTTARTVPRTADLRFGQPGPPHQHYAPASRPATAGEDTIHKTVFLGESSPLTCVVDEGRRSPDKGYVGKNQTGRLHYSISETRAVEPSQDPLGERRRILHDRLTQEGALVFPSAAICDTLFEAYFEWFHPCFPVLDRRGAQNGYRESTISPLLVQAMLFIGVSLCSDSVLHTTGFNDRYQAKGVFYQHAKEIYDSGWETDTIVKLQSLFLLSFWRGGPNEERDVRFWLGAAIALAQKKGMHVMSKLSFLSTSEQRIWKRIWWALYVRDQQTSAALGLPSRIRDEDCEITELQPSDFEDNGISSEIFRKPPAVYVSYVIRMAQLARLLREVVSSQYLPGQSEFESPARPSLHQRLVEWESNLPEEMRFQAPMSRESMFLLGMLHMTYNNLYILLYRPLFIQPLREHTQLDGGIALDAAARSTRILEDMLSEGLVQHGSLHLITHTFSALCIHTIQFGRTTSTARKLAEHRAKLCLLGLKELQKSWDLENWVLDLFFRCLDDRTARDLRLADVAVAPSTLSRHSVRASQRHDFVPQPTSCIGTESVPNHDHAIVPVTNTGLDLNTAEDTVNMDWYDLFNVGDDFMGIAGSLSNPDYLNPQNLEFLYRFL